MKNRKRIVVVSALLAVFVLAGCNREAEEQDSEEKLPKVDIQNITRQDSIQSELKLSGVVTAIQQTDITSLVSGTVLFLVPVGQNVSVGEQMFVLQDASVETSFLNSQISLDNATQNLGNTELIANESITQAKLGLSSSESSLNLAMSNNQVAKNQAKQNVLTAENSAVTAYTTAYNTMSQALNFVTTSGFLNNDNYLYKNLTQASSQLRSNAVIQHEIAKSAFLDLPQQADRDNLDKTLEDLHVSLSEIKDLIDLTVLILQEATLYEPFANLVSDRTQVVSYQSQLNSHVNSIIIAQNNLVISTINAQSIIDSAQSQLELAQIQYENAQTSLTSTNRSAELQVLGAQNNLNSVKTQFDVSAIQFQNLALAAPFSGTITKHFINVGDQVRLGQALLEIGDLNAVKIDVEVASSEAENLQIGQTVVIDGTKTGVIKSIQPVADSVTGKVKIEIESDNESDTFIIGDLAKIKIDLVYTIPESIFVPLKSITVGQNENFVYVLDEDNLVQKSSVTLGKVFGQKVEITSGLESGQKMIIKNGTFLSPGDEVEISNEQ